MSWYLAIPFAVLVIAFILRMPIGFGMLIGSIAYFIIKGISIGTFVNTICYGLTGSYILIAIPLFIFTANVMNASAITDKIYDFTTSIIGRRRGASAYVNVIGSLIFAGMTGSAVADAAGIGMLEISHMKKEGYDVPFSCATTAASAVLGPIFPPSIPFVIYAMVSGASVGKLFLGGMVPAVLLSLVMCIYVYYISKKRQYPYGNIVTFKQFLSATFKALPALLTPVVLLGGIYAGIMTPTEAASVAAAYALIISIGIYRTLSLKALLKVLLNTIRTTGTIFLVIAAAYSFSYIIAAEGLSQALVKTLTSMTTSPAVFLILVNILFLILGCLVDVNVSQLVVVPLIMPLVHFYNIDLVHFGVMICLNMMIGLITPPFGMLLFITSGLGKISLKSLIKETAPYIILEIVALAIIVVFPQTVLFLTNLIK